MPWSKIKPEHHVMDGTSAAPDGTRVLSYAEAVREALDLAMERDPRVFVMGQGVDDPSGMFGTTLGLHRKYGPGRVFDTPLAETALTGVAVGAALGGMRPVYFHNRPDFLLLAMDQLVNHASKWSFMFGGAARVPLVVWACTGRGWGSAAQHSQALHALFMHVPGLHVVMPSSPGDAKGLLLSALEDGNPVVILEHRMNFRQKGHVPPGYHLAPMGKGRVVRTGGDVTLVAISHMVTESVNAAGILAREGIEADVIDLRTLHPLDEALILSSAEKTRRVVVADTGWKTGGMTAEIAARIAEKGFGRLRAPIRRVACPDVPTPAGYTLEKAFYPGAEDIASAARELAAWKD